MTPYLFEFLGTATLLLFGVGVCANCSLKNTYGLNAGWVAISLGWGFAVFAGVIVASYGSDAHINPAVTIGFAVAGKFAWNLVPGYIIAQLLGAMAGAGLAWLTYKEHYDQTEDQGTQLGTFATGPAIPNTVFNIISEVIGTFALLFGIFFITKSNIGGQEASLGSMDALPVSLLVVAIGLSLGGTTGYAINPARDLGPRIMHFILPIRGKGGSNWGYSWIPIVAPIVGAALAAVVYMAIVG